MFDNIGGKIKTLAEVVSYIGIAASIIIGIIIILTIASIEAVFIGLLVFIVGSLLSWISSFVLYGFGQLIENSEIIAKTLAPDSKNKTNSKEKDDNINGNNTPVYDYANTNIKSSNWEESIKLLTDEALYERANSDDYQAEYRVLCKKELESRNLHTM